MKQLQHVQLKKQATYGLIIVVGFFVLGLAVIKASHASTSRVSAEAESGNATAQAVRVSGGGASGNAAIKFTAPQAQCGSGGSCTTAQVATHNSKTNCWVIYSNKVYNINAWVPEHPGGEAVFNSTTCGHDITPYLTGQSSVNGDKHKHSSDAYNDLETFYIAPLQ